MEDYEFKLGKYSVLLDGNEILIITYGSMCSVALKTAKDLSEKNAISACVINLHTLRPIDPNLKEILKKFKEIFIIEEHSEVGGLRSIISDLLIKENIRPNLFKGLSLPPKYLSSGTYEELLNDYELTNNDLKNLILGNL